MESYDFTLRIDGETDVGERLEHLIVNADCTDGTVGSSCGIVRIMFTRSGQSLAHVIADAQGALRKVGLITSWDMGA